MSNDSILSKVKDFFNETKNLGTIISLWIYSTFLIIFYLYTIEISKEILLNKTFEDAYNAFVNLKDPGLFEQFKLMLYAIRAIVCSFIQFIYKDFFTICIFLLHTVLFGLMLFSAVKCKCIFFKILYYIALPLPFLFVMFGTIKKGQVILNEISKSENLKYMIELYVKPEVFFMLLFIFIFYLLAKHYHVLYKAKAEFIRISEKKQLERRILQLESKPSQKGEVSQSE